MENRLVERKNLINNLNEVYIIIKDALRSYELWWSLISREIREKYFKTMLLFKEFFELVAYSALVSMTISLSKLYENKSNRLSLESILNEATRQKAIELNLNKKFMRKLIEARILAKKILILRSNLIAHRNYKLSVEEIYKKANLTPNKIKRLLDISIIIFNSIFSKLEKRPKKIKEMIGLTSGSLTKILENLDKQRGVR